ncbi:MAG TPA: c-type cytochrome, partial [Armatimonadota bacterium]|nr:c-type cytochrome [Armatimonadota bacterium]
PRGLTLTADERGLLVANYFSDTVSLIDARSGKLVRTIALGPEPKMDGVRRGEFLFADATMCFQHWQSCLSCHPDGRSDGLMWDLMNDGLGNPKNAKSLLLSGATPPVMAHGVRDTMRTAIDAGFRYILFRVPEEADVDAVEIYLNSMKPSRSPVLDNKEMKKRADRGRKLFMDAKRTGCVTCHPAELYTDLQMHNVGTQSQFDREGEFDTPTLVELFRSAPYLHDGTAVTLKDVLTTRNTGDMHGKTSGLSPEEIEDLALFLQSL